MPTCPGLCKAWPPPYGSKVLPGDRVAFLLRNGPEIVLCYYACFKIGAIAVPLNVRFDAELLTVRAYSQWCENTHQ